MKTFPCDSRDINYKILNELDDKEILDLRLVSKQFNDLVLEEYFWKSKCVNKYGKDLIKFKAQTRTWRDFYFCLKRCIDKQFDSLDIDVRNAIVNLNVVEKYINKNFEVDIYDNMIVVYMSDKIIGIISTLNCSVSKYGSHVADRGDTLLLKLSEKEYLYIGKTVYKFYSKEEISQFKVYDGWALHPYAIDVKNNVYIMELRLIMCKCDDLDNPCEKYLGERDIFNLREDRRYLYRSDAGGGYWYYTHNAAEHFRTYKAQGVNFYTADAVPNNVRFAGDTNCQDATEEEYVNYMREYEESKGYEHMQCVVFV